ncbi:DnaJ-like subfamily B member 13 [Vitis vinifera]|uniref:DnaJ-like subfamily B member 13 n=1 Tax=Vitis vinifera TaxID=29760 RepID=A0A438J6W7_VITVI|nr:DnaJ-like subfamily B member 13 [Vitis vinifera]
MGDPPRSPTPDFYSILGISRGASILDVCKAYKSLAKKWHPDKNPSNKPEAQAKFQAINEAIRRYAQQEEHHPHLPIQKCWPQSTNPNSLSKSASRRSNSAGTSTDFAASLSKSTSRRSTTLSSIPSRQFGGNHSPLRRSLSAHWRSCAMDATRDQDHKRCHLRHRANSSRRGDTTDTNKTRMEARNKDEKRHPIFKRVGDNLEIGVEIPLVKAITGCPLSVPLLGGEKMSLFIDDIIYHGYEKIIPGQGMPMAKQEGRRGDLKIKFLVSFPTELSDQQRSDVYRILQDSS